MSRVDPDELTDVVTALVGELASAETASVVATSLVGANLRGHDSHGVRLLPAKYASEVAEGKIDPAAEPTLDRLSTHIATVDGRWAFGQLAARDAVDTAVALADEQGVGVVGLHRVSHIGRVGEWIERAAPDVALLAFVANPGSRWVAPPGTATRRLSTNPIAVGIPTYGALPFPIVHDAATSQVAHGKIRQHAAENRPLPEEWTVDADGTSLTDPEKFEEADDGAILPLGGLTSGYKGFGLAVVSELLAGLVTGGSVSGTEEETWGNHTAFIALDLEQFSSRSDIRDKIDAFASYIRSTPSAPDVPIGNAGTGDEVLLPGESEYRTLEKRRRSGIPLPSADCTLLLELGNELGVDDAILTSLET